MSASARLMKVDVGGTMGNGGAKMVQVLLTPSKMGVLATATWSDGLLGVLSWVQQELRGAQLDANRRKATADMAVSLEEAVARAQNVLSQLHAEDVRTQATYGLFGVRADMVHITDLSLESARTIRIGFSEPVPGSGPEIFTGLLKSSGLSSPGKGIKVVGRSLTMTLSVKAARNYSESYTAIAQLLAENYP